MHFNPYVDHSSPFIGKKRHPEPGKESECREDNEVVETDDDQQQTGFVGDILEVEAPQGSLDVGFI